MSCPHLFDVAPYALGTLDPGGRAGVAAHLASCTDCQTVLESVAGLPGLLARVGPDAVEPAVAEPDELEPDEAMFERLVALAHPGGHVADQPEQPSLPPAAVQGRSARRTGRWRRWAAAGVAAAAVAAGTGTWLMTNPGRDAVRLVAASSGDVHARAWLRPSGSGTAIRLELGGVAGEQQCWLITVDRDGHRTVASTWEAGYTSVQTFESKVPLPIDRLASLHVETDHGVLLTMPVQ
jgi:Putative zinc-finger